MQETIIAAGNGWYLLVPRLEGGRAVEARRLPIIAWRIGADGPTPVTLGGEGGAVAGGEAAVMHPSGSVWSGSSEHRNLGAFLATLGRSVPPPPPASPPADEPTPAQVPPSKASPARLQDPELTDEDRAHLMVQLLNVHGEEFVLHAHEWEKALALARDQGGWSARGTHHPGIPGWEGRYSGPHNQRVQADDARAFADALERALPSLAQPRSADFVAHTPDSVLVGLPPSEYLGGVKGRRYVEALIAFARCGEFRIT
jgi:hypothetical protein